MGVVCHGNLGCFFHIRIKLDTVSGADGKAVALAKSGLIRVGRYFFYRVPECLCGILKALQSLGTIHLKGNIVKACLVSQTKGYGMMIELIIAFEHNATVLGASHLIKTKDVGVEIQGLVQIQYPHLNQSGA